MASQLVKYEPRSKVERYVTDKEFRTLAPDERRAVGVRKGIGGVVQRLARDAGEALQQAGQPIPFVCSTGTVDRYDSTIAVDGWDLVDFARNAVGLWSHMAEAAPIIRWQNWRTDDALRMDAVFVPREVMPFAGMVEDLYRLGFMNAVSVGFIPVSYEVDDDRDGKGWMPPINYLRQILTECSAVTVPGNQEALMEGRALAERCVQARGAGVDVRPMVAHLERTLDLLRNGEQGRADFEKLRAALGGAVTHSTGRAGAEDGMSARKRIILVAECNEADLARTKDELDKRARGIGAAVIRLSDGEESGGDGDESLHTKLAAQVSTLTDQVKKLGAHCNSFGDHAKALDTHNMAFGDHAKAFGGHNEKLGAVCKELQAGVDALKPDDTPKTTAKEGAPAPEARGGASHKMSAANAKDHQAATDAIGTAKEALDRMAKRHAGDDPEAKPGDEPQGGDDAQKKAAEKAALEERVLKLQRDIDAAKQQATGKVAPKR